MNVKELQAGYVVAVNGAWVLRVPNGMHRYFEALDGPNGAIAYVEKRNAKEAANAA